MNIPVLLIAIALMLAGCGDGPASAREIHEESRTAVTEHTGPIAGVRTEPAGPRRLRLLLDAYGTVVANAERTRTVSARFPGVVTEVRKSPGEAVLAGETLALVESNESLQVYAVKSPIAGVVTLRQVNAGETVETQPLFTVSDLRVLWAELAVYPRDLPRIRLGQPVMLRASEGLPPVETRIAHISPLGAAGTQAILVRALVDNASGAWRPGLNVSASIVIEEAAVAVAVDAHALQTVDGARVVFVPHEGGFAPRVVEVGRTDDEFTEILSGLAAGESHVVTDSFLVKAELEKAGASHEH